MAIAFDAEGSGNGTGTSVDATHVCTGANRLLLVGVYKGTNNADEITGVTYSGVAMTRVNTQNGPNFKIYLYALIAPATGSNTITASCSTSRFIQIFSGSYTGVSQTGFPDAETSSNINSTGLTETLTTVADNCWLGGVFNNDGSAMSAGANTTLRHAASAMAIADSNAARSIGSNSIAVTWTGAANGQGCICSFAPALDAAPTVFPQFFPMI